MQEPTHKPEAPSDDEIAAMLSGGKPRKKRNDTEPSPRLPEAVYYYLFILAESAIVLGLWGFMSRGSEGVLHGPTLDSPILEQVVFYLKSLWGGFVQVLTERWWVPLGLAIGSAAVFVPRTPRDRKRLTTLICGIIVTVFVVLIALPFADDMGSTSKFSTY